MGLSFKHRAPQYNEFRKADPRLTDFLERALRIENRGMLLDIGAGVGNYSIEFINRGYQVISIEPEPSMRMQCVDNRVRWICSTAESLPLDDSVANGALIINALHHFSNIESAINEVFRVLKSGTLLILTFDPEVLTTIWLYDYWPELKEYILERYFPMSYLSNIISSISENCVEIFPYCIPSDFEDKFSAALWQRPELLLNDCLRGASSVFNSVDQSIIETGAKKLSKDIKSGEWRRKQAKLLKTSSYDVGCRVIRAKKSLLI